MIGDPEHRESRFLRILRVFGVVIGVAIVSYLIHEVGWKQIEHSLG